MDNIFAVNSGTTSVFLDLPLLESAAGLTLVGADSSGAPFSDEFQLGFLITEETNFALTPPFSLFVGSIEHSGTVTLALGETEVTVGDFSIGFDPTRASETTTGYFVADTLDDALGLEILFDVAPPVAIDPAMADADAETISLVNSNLLLDKRF